MIIARSIFGSTRNRISFNILVDESIMLLNSIKISISGSFICQDPLSNFVFIVMQGQRLKLSGGYIAFGNYDRLSLRELKHNTTGYLPDRYNFFSIIMDKLASSSPLQYVIFETNIVIATLPSLPRYQIKLFLKQRLSLN